MALDIMLCEVIDMNIVELSICFTNIDIRVIVLIELCDGASLFPDKYMVVWTRSQTTKTTQYIYLE